jgi:hypothetical protein
MIVLTLSTPQTLSLNCHLTQIISSATGCNFDASTWQQLEIRTQACTTLTCSRARLLLVSPRRHRRRLEAANGMRHIRPKSPKPSRGWRTMTQWPHCDSDRGQAEVGKLSSCRSSVRVRVRATACVPAIHDEDRETTRFCFEGSGVPNFGTCDLTLTQAFNPATSSENRVPPPNPPNLHCMLAIRRDSALGLRAKDGGSTWISSDLPIPRLRP